MASLYMIGLGGTAPGANIEVHDMQLIIGDTPQECYVEASRRWYGESLHIDSYTEIQYLDGFQIDWDGSLDQNLYLIVYGGYHETVIDEIHRYDMIVAASKQEAKRIAKQAMNRFEYIDHVDNVVDVFDNCGRRFGLTEGPYSFSDNQTTHTFIKLR